MTDNAIELWLIGLGVTGVLLVCAVIGFGLWLLFGDPLFKDDNPVNKGLHLRTKRGYEE